MPGSGTTPGVPSSLRSTPSMRRISASACRPVPAMAASAWRARSGDAVQRVGGPVGLHHHHAHVVRDDVVQFPGDPGPLGGRRDLGLGVTFGLQPGGPVLQRGVVAAPVAHRVAEHPGDQRRAGEGDRAEDEPVQQARARAGATGPPRPPSRAGRRPGRERTPGAAGRRPGCTAGPRSSTLSMFDLDVEQHLQGADRHGHGEGAGTGESRRKTMGWPARVPRGAAGTGPRRWPSATPAKPRAAASTLSTSLGWQRSQAYRAATDQAYGRGASAGRVILRAGPASSSRVRPGRRRAEAAASRGTGRSGIRGDAGLRAQAHAAAVTGRGHPAGPR